MTDGGGLRVPDCNTGMGAAPPELLVASRTELFVELTNGYEDGSLNKEVRGRAKTLVDVPILAEEPARVDELRDSTHMRDFQLDPACDPWCDRERSQSLFEPVLMRSTIHVGERQLVARRQPQAGIARRI